MSLLTPGEFKASKIAFALSSRNPSLIKELHDPYVIGSSHMLLTEFSPYFSFTKIL